MFQVAIKINILYMQYIKLVALKIGATDTHDTYGINTHTDSSYSLSSNVNCQRAGWIFFSFNCNTWYLICEMFRNLEASSVSAWSLLGCETGGVHPTQLKKSILLMAHSCLPLTPCAPRPIICHELHWK